MTDLAPLFAALQAATGIRVTNGQIVLHIGNGAIQKVETTSVQRVTATQPVEVVSHRELVDKLRASGA